MVDGDLDDDFPLPRIHFLGPVQELILGFCESCGGMCRTSLMRLVKSDHAQRCHSFCACPTYRAQGNTPSSAYHHEFNLFLSRLDEQPRRWHAELESLRIGHGGDRFSAHLTGLSERTVCRAPLELLAKLCVCAAGRVRDAGAGRHAAEVQDPTLERTLLELVEPETADDRQRPGK